ncbi:MAG: hypothetical protein OIF55_16905 [Amphritea sp.]|nr:hypothetical protein [Amphritea sp.]
MNLEQGLNTWLTEQTGLAAYWLERPAGVNRCVVYRCISPGQVEGNLKDPGIRSDLYSITVYNDDPEKAKAASDTLRTLHTFHGDLGGYPVHRITLAGGFDQPLRGESGISVYQFNRDFTIHH